jgi:threonine aldolase
MNTRPIDLRSDTMTRPTAAMRAAMAAAEVGDDMVGEDPTVTALETRIATILGKETAVFVPSGTMSNQLAVRVHCQPGDELLCEANCHIFHYEQGAYAQLFGIAAQPIQGEHGILRLDQLEERIRPDNDHTVHMPGLTLDPEIIDTNIVIFKLAPELGTAAEFTCRLCEQGALFYDIGRQRSRAVTHLDVSLEDVKRAGQILRDVAANAAIMPVR